MMALISIHVVPRNYPPSNVRAPDCMLYKVDASQYYMQGAITSYSTVALGFSLAALFGAGAEKTH